MNVCKKQILVWLLSIFALSLDQSSAAVSGVAANFRVNLTLTSSFWFGPYYMSFINVAGTTTEQTTDQSTAGLLKGSTSVARFNNKFILTGAPKASRLVAVWDGPGSASLYPYLAYFAKGNNPVKLPGWSIGALLVQDPANNASTVKGALAVKQSQNLVVPATDNPTVPNGSKSISGITRYTFGVKDTSPSNACVGWGTYVSDFKRLFSGKATLTGSGVLTQVVN